MQLLVGNMDRFMISHLDSAAVAAIGNGNQVMNVVIIVLETMSAATTILLPQHIGAGRAGEPCDEIATVGTALTALFSLLMGALLLLAPHVLFAILRTPEEAFAGACLYTRIVGGGRAAPGAVCGAVELYAAKRGRDGVHRHEFAERGGRRMSTCISKGVGLLLVIWTLRRKCGSRFYGKYLRPFPAATCKKLLGFAMPSGTEALSYNVSQILILRFINLMGTTVIATKVYASMLANVAYVYAIAVAQATQIILGYMLGGRKLNEVPGRVWSTIRIALAVPELLTLLLYIFSPPFTASLSATPLFTPWAARSFWWNLSWRAAAPSTS